MRPKHDTTTEGEIPITYRVGTGKDYHPSRRRISLSHSSSSCAAEHFDSDASLESADRRAPNNLKNLPWTMEGDVSER